MQAQITVRTLQHERELAQRIEQGITQLRAGTAPASAAKKVVPA